MHRRIAVFRGQVAREISARRDHGDKLTPEALACIEGNRASRRAALRKFRPPRTALDRAFSGVARR